MLGPAGPRLQTLQEFLSFLGAIDTGVRVTREYLELAGIDSLEADALLLGRRNKKQRLFPHTRFFLKNFDRCFF